MNVCFPAEGDEGIHSPVYGHFGSAPMFIIMDTETMTITTVSNRNRIHEHGRCNPLASLDGYAVDTVIAGGIGAGALNKLHAAGIRVFKALGGTIGENAELLRSNALCEFRPENTCGGHAHSHGCSH